MSAKQFLFYDDDGPDGPPVIDAAETNRAIVRSLYAKGKYEQWCRDFGKDPTAYWAATVGGDYAAHRLENPVPQLQPEPEPVKKASLVRRLFGR